ncbi:MAG: MBOAT family protein [Bacteroidota bacterium]
MKVIAVTQGYKNKPLTLSFTQWLVFAAGWAGMRAEPFETLGQKPLPNAWPMIRFGVSRVIGGLLLIGLAHLTVKLPVNHNFVYITATGLLLIAMSLILHFGLLNISAGIWRLKGVNAYSLFRQPAKSINLTELWGKRWNIAFSEMTAIAVYRPVRNKLGNAAGLIAGFVFSGLLHELALSLPVKTGYGLPMLYFIIQGLMVLMEKVLTRHNPGFLQNKIVAHAWVFFWIVLPMPLLFHAAFIRDVVWPLAGF